MHTKATLHILDVRVLLALFIVLMELIFINSLASAGMEFVFSSAAVTLALLIQLRFAIRPTAASPADMVVFIFNWLFLDLAPKVQLMSMPQHLINTSTVAVGEVALTNLVCALFMVSFTLFYGFLSRRAEEARPRGAAPATPGQEFTAGGVGLAVVVCVCVVAIAAPSAYASIENSVAASPASLVMKRCLLFLPSATLLIILHETVRSGRKLLFSRICVILLLLVLVVITENPYTEKRNALGPLYIALLLVAFPKFFAGWARRMWLFVGGMVLIFPAITVFTHNHLSVGEVSMAQVSDQIVDHYFSINYDSWANIYTAVEIAGAHGVQWGHQLLGSLLFFVPSGVWSTKPLATGIFLADYLIVNYSMWFTNLSAPLIAEGYLDFGFVGVILYAGATAYVVTLLNKIALRSNRWVSLPLAVYGAVFLMIVLRGSLMVALGFASAALLAFGAASALLSVKLGVRHRLPKRAGAQPTIDLSRAAGAPNVCE
jgi:hypothetical protein